jgi:aryl-alcohol dehydrogenase-like predicted oxidoreductase
MQYRKLGASDLKVSSVCLGTMVFGEQTGPAEAHRIMDAARDRGVDFIDTAEAYPVPARVETQGRTEEIIGDWIEARGGRDKLVLATKVVGRAERAGHVRSGKSRPDRQNVMAAIEASLKRLKTDYIDLYWLHFPDRATNNFENLGYAHRPDDAAVPIGETLAAMAELKRQGKIRAFGASNETPWGVMQYLRLAEKDSSLPRIAAIQNPYCLTNRAFDVGLAELCLKENVASTPWSPLCFGGLTGKYDNGAKPELARLTLHPGGGWARYTWPRALKAYAAYSALARRHGLTPTGMALAFAASRPFNASVIIGARTEAQARENIELIEKTGLSPEVLQGIEAIHADNPNPVMK